MARACAREAGELALQRFRQPQEVAVKGRGNFVSPTDLEIESLIGQALASEFPNHGVLSEETASETGLEGWVWVIDPLDGTHNFLSGIPFFCTNIALCHDGEPVVAVTHDPNHGESFWAERGRGAWVNDEPLHASKAEALRDAVFGIDLGYHDERGRALLQLTHKLFPGVQCVRLNGSAALGLAYVAAGRYDVFL
ncbi:MAG: inositol monophosphatase family protein, partial [Dehalococcoidia bacterium]|nr:inositol monophosphatase family protein [Dehalococcoidia bacterium]